MVNRAWIDDWNDIIRNVIFKDEELKKLMKIPEGTKIMEFVDRYFVRAGYSTKVLTDEAVRIVYGDSFSMQTNSPLVTRNEMSFDIYVNLKDIHNVSNEPGADRLVMRTQLIAMRLVNLLTQKRYLGSYRFWVVGERDIGTSTVGYTRYNVTFSYMKSY